MVLQRSAQVKRRPGSGVVKRLLWKTIPDRWTNRVGQASAGLLPWLVSGEALSQRMSELSFAFSNVHLSMAHLETTSTAVLPSGRMQDFVILGILAPHRSNEDRCL